MYTCTDIYVKLFQTKICILFYSLFSFSHNWGIFPILIYQNFFANSFIKMQLTRNELCICLKCIVCKVLKYICLCPSLSEVSSSPFVPPSFCQSLILSLQISVHFLKFYKQKYTLYAFCLLFFTVIIVNTSKFVCISSSCFIIADLYSIF